MDPRIREEDKEVCGVAKRRCAGWPKGGVRGDQKEVTARHHR